MAGLVGWRWTLRAVLAVWAATVCALAAAGCTQSAGGTSAASVSSAAPSADPSAAPSTARPDRPTAPRVRYQTVAFADRSHGWAIGWRCPSAGSDGGYDAGSDAGCVAGLDATADGGASWHRQAGGLPRVDRLAFAGPARGYAWEQPSVRCRAPQVRCTRRILATDDGRSWRPAGSLPPGFTSLAVGDGGELLAATTRCAGGLARQRCAGELLRSGDAGRHWTVAVRLPAAVRAVASGHGVWLVTARSTGRAYATSVAVLRAPGSGGPFRTVVRTTLDAPPGTVQATVAPVSDRAAWLATSAMESCSMHGCAAAGLFGVGTGQVVQVEPVTPIRFCGLGGLPLVSLTPSGRLFAVGIVNRAACSPPGATLVTASGLGPVARRHAWPQLGATALTWLDDTRGWAVIAGKLATTRDGGRTWRPVGPRR